MARHAIINSLTKRVANVVEWDGGKEWKPPQGHFSVESHIANIGEYYNEAENKFQKEKIK